MKKKPNDFELVQVHTRGENMVEVTIRDKNNILAYQGTLTIHPKPGDVYPPDYELGPFIEPGIYSFNFKNEEHGEADTG